MAKDWFEWHELYQTENVLQQRLEIVRKYISNSLDTDLLSAVGVHGRY